MTCGCTATHPGRELALLFPSEKEGSTKGRGLRLRRERHRAGNLKMNREASSRVFLAIAMVTEAAEIKPAWGPLLRFQKCVQAYSASHSSLLWSLLLSRIPWGCEYSKRKQSGAPCKRTPVLGHAAQAALLLVPCKHVCTEPRSHPGMCTHRNTKTHPAVLTGSHKQTHKGMHTSQLKHLKTHCSMVRRWMET